MNQITTLMMIGVSGIFLLLAILVFLVQAVVKLLRELKDQCRTGSFEVHTSGKPCVPVVLPCLTKAMRKRLNLLARSEGCIFAVFETEPDMHVVPRPGQPKIIPWDETK